MPKSKRAKARAKSRNHQREVIASTANPSALRRKKVVRVASILVVFALVATVIVGAMSASPAKAAEPASSTVSANTARTLTATPEPDTDGDGIPNNADPDIDGDGIVNGVDPDIDGDGVANANDSDPAGTNGETPGSTKTNSGGTAPLPRLIPTELDNPLGRTAITLVILGAGAAVIVARRKHK